MGRHFFTLNFLKLIFLTPFLTLQFFSTKNPKKSNFPNKNCVKNISVNKNIVLKNFSVKIQKYCVNKYKSIVKKFKEYCVNKF